MNKSRNLVEVRRQSKEAVFEILDGGSGDKKTETWKVLSASCLLPRLRQWLKNSLSYKSISFSTDIS